MHKQKVGRPLYTVNMESGQKGGANVKKSTQSGQDICTTGRLNIYFWPYTEIFGSPWYAFDVEFGRINTEAIIRHSIHRSFA